MEIRKADSRDIAAIDRLYTETVAFLESHTNYPGWKSNVYPTSEDAESAISEGALFIAEENGRAVGSFILRHSPERGYENISWGIESDYSRIYVIYTFMVHPSAQCRGAGHAMIEYIIDLCRREGMNAIRLDVVSDNLPAIRLYEKAGFRYVATADLGYGMYGLDSFALYQMIL